ncbi:hypothetical protein TELCIR_20387 [Teladorsagia circumcincta]|uniref:Uncharacterized protein n=1 Tax=Teladorsagia circumcincta TaxID=45464 RepID=A0A2G9TJL7_TELCI|nr:hypothetical protein TELCIR_20387 [Teladorsagia circumcincta]
MKNIREISYFREEHRTLCACTTKDRCNDPTSPIANFKFSDSRILEGYQFTPLVGGGGGPPSGGALDTSKLTGGETAKPKDEHTTPEPVTQGTTTHGNATKASASYLMSLAMIVGSFTMIIASLMIF